MKLQNLVCILAFITIYNNHIQTASYFHDDEINDLLTIPPYHEFDYKEEIEESFPAPKSLAAYLYAEEFHLSPTFNFEHDNPHRNLNTLKGRDEFNAAIRNILKQAMNTDSPRAITDSLLDQTPIYSIQDITAGEINKIKTHAKNKTLIFDFENIFNTQVKLTFMPDKSKKHLELANFCHDYLHAVENSEIFKFSNKKHYTDGFYSANIAIDVKTPKLKFHKNFFPSNWTRAQVIDCILLSMQNVTSKPSIKNRSDAKIYLFKIPLLYKHGRSITKTDHHLMLVIKIEKGTNKASLVAANPDL